VWFVALQEMLKKSPEFRTVLATHAKKHGSQLEAAKKKVLGI
jgi:hypothetical protein